MGHVLGGIGGGGLGRPQAQPAVGTLGGVLAKRRLELDLGGECGRWMERGLFQPKCRGSRPLAQEVSTQGQVVVWVEITKDALTLGFILWAVASAGALAISRGALLALSLSPQNRGPGHSSPQFSLGSNASHCLGSLTMEDTSQRDPGTACGATLPTRPPAGLTSDLVLLPPGSLSPTTSSSAAPTTGQLAPGAWTRGRCPGNSGVTATVC